ncbi:hypothetical protein D3C78_571310 [compost metagenome]
MRGGIPKIANQGAGYGQGMSIVFGQVVGHPGVGAVHQGPPQCLGADLLAGGGFDQGRARQEDGGLFPDHDGLIRHGGHIGAPCGAQPHHHGELGDVLGRHAGLVVEDAAKMLPVGEHLVLHGEEGTAGIHQIEAGEAQPLGDGLGPQVLFHRERVVGAPLDGGVVHHQQAEPARNLAEPCDDAGGGHGFLIDLPGGQGRELEEGGARVQQLIDALAGQQLATALMAGVVGRAAALGYLGEAGVEIGHQGLHGLPIGGKVGARCIQAGVDLAHGFSPIWLLLSMAGDKGRSIMRYLPSARGR